MLYEVITEEHVFETDFQRMMPKLGEVTALFCAADLLAVELMAFLRQRQIRIPDDISLVGFDDLYISRIVTPALTTIRQDVVQKGMAAVQLLVDAIQDKAIADRRIVVITSYSIHYTKLYDTRQVGELYARFREVDETFFEAGERYEAFVSDLEGQYLNTGAEVVR